MRELHVQASCAAAASASRWRKWLAEAQALVGGAGLAVVRTSPIVSLMPSSAHLRKLAVAAFGILINQASSKPVVSGFWACTRECDINAFQWPS